jgi:diguanylate cyclase (GGDEF)-like protein
MRVLIADDDAITRQLLSDWLTASGCDVVTATNGTSALALLEKPDGPRFAILGWCMPGMDGIDVCRRLRSAEHGEYTYVVLLTARKSEADFDAGIEAGVDDYLTKPCDPAQLRLCLRTGGRITRVQEEVRKQASQDGLTGLPNRATVRERLAREVARGTRDGGPVGVVMADIDHFKRVNDTYGHPAGDVVLREVARRMENALRPYDTVGRHGGEEFLLVLPGCDLPRARAAAEHVRTAVKADPIHTDAGRLRVTVSLGVTAAGRESRFDIETLVTAADAALYAAKHAGRDRVAARPAWSDPARAL